jgi:tetratricopeptide (TPR) repeat protein
VTDAGGVADSGTVAGRDVNLSGTWVGGRDVNIYQTVQAPPAMRTGLFELPPDIDDFTNREAALRTVRRHLERSGGKRATAVTISAIAGQAGVGKTALATRVAHQLRPRFPDGQLYVNLRGTEAQRLKAADVLTEFLLELGIARGAIPERVDRRAALYRAQLADRRILVVLDNAAEENQVRPLLPGSPGCAALITSRVPLHGLYGTQPILLDVMERDQALQLLGKVAGPRRVAGELEAARAIVELCGYLPLAVRIAGAKLATRPHWSLAMLAERLTDEHTRLAELRIRDLEVRASFDLSYRELDEDKRRTFRLLGLLKGPDFTAWAAGALIGREPSEAEELLEGLVEAQVLEIARQAEFHGEPRYRFHDLMRVFARDCLWNEEQVAAQETALRHALDAHLDLARRADELLQPGSAARADPLAPNGSRVAARLAADPAAWLESERVNLIVAVEQAFENGLFPLAWKLAGSLAYFFKLRSHWRDWQHTQEIALKAARQAGDEGAAANALHSLGEVGNQRGRFKESVVRFEQALDLFGALQDRRGEAWTLVGLGDAYLEQSRLTYAEAEFEQALRLFQGLGDQRGEGWALAGLGIVRRAQGRFGNARVCLEQALAMLRARGLLYRDQGQLEEAVVWFERARPIFQQFGDHQGQTYVLLNIGYLYRQQNRLEEALPYLEESLVGFRQLGDRTGEAWTLFSLGIICHARGRLDEASDYFRGSQGLFRSLADRRGQARALAGMGDVERERGRVEDALDLLNRALPMLREIGSEIELAKALSGHGLTLAAKGDHEAAAVAWREALRIFRLLDAPEASTVERWLQR